MYLIIFSASILLFLWLFQIIFLKTYYREFRLNKLENSVKKVLNSFQRFYWKLKSADKDIEELQAECELIRSDYVGGKDFLLSLINENFEIDYKQVHLENRKDTIKPK
jgi:hypothetical protein